MRGDVCHGKPQACGIALEKGQTVLPPEQCDRRALCRSLFFMFFGALYRGVIRGTWDVRSQGALLNRLLDVWGKLTKAYFKNDNRDAATKAHRGILPCEGIKSTPHGFSPHDNLNQLLKDIKSAAGDVNRAGRDF